jgi:hypothetical protein
VTGGLAAWIEKNQTLADGLGRILVALTAIGSASGLAKLLALIASKTGLSSLARVAGALGLATGVGEVAALAYANLPTSTGAEPNIYENGQLTDYGRKITGQGGGAFGSQQEKEAFIRQSAVKAGINPDVAMAVARSEGFNSFSGDNGTSGGAFQLHVTPGGRGKAVGDQFKSLTGLDPLDPANEHEGIEFAMEWAKRHGWKDFHGAARTGVGDHQGIGEVNITVQTDSKDPREHGRVAADAFKSRVNSNIATQANTGLN